MDETNVGARYSIEFETRITSERILRFRFDCLLESQSCISPFQSLNLGCQRIKWLLYLLDHQLCGDLVQSLNQQHAEDEGPCAARINRIWDKSRSASVHWI